MRAAGGECSQTTDPAPPTGLVSPKMSKSDTKGFQCTGRMNENLGIMRLCFVRMRAAQAFVSDLDIHGSFRAPALAAGGARWGHYRQPEPWATRSVHRAGGFDRGPGPMATPPRRSFVARAGTRPVWSRIPGAGHARSAPGRVSPQGPPVRPRPGGAGLIEPGLAALGQGLAALPQRQESSRGRSPPQDAARRPPAPHGPAHS